MRLLFFVLGAVFGSAGNAIIDRLPQNISWVKGRSFCDSCKHELGFWDLVPLLSFLLLGGKCRYCHKKIPMRNFGVELVTALGFVFLPWQLWGVWWVTIIIAVMDWETQLVSEAMVVVWGALAIMTASLGWLGLAVSLGVIGGLWAISKGRAMGFGDVEIGAVLGLWLGWPKAGIALWAAFVIGAVVGVVKLARKTSKLGSEIAFGPFLIIGGWIAYFWGGKIIAWLFPF